MMLLPLWLRPPICPLCHTRTLTPKAPPDPNEYATDYECSLCARVWHVVVPRTTEDPDSPTGYRAAETGLEPRSTDETIELTADARHGCACGGVRQAITPYGTRAGAGRAPSTASTTRVTQETRRP